MTTQLRMYTINRGALQQFAQEWNDNIRPSWEELDQAYFNSDERLAMDPNPARNIARMEEYFMKPALIT